jgi:predicted ribosome quality control (RQC) complex YloA/Tae2 family protein
MGKDKFENEELIKHAWPEDVWFHVDRESSAHVYIRLPRCCSSTSACILTTLARPFQRCE